MDKVKFLGLIPARYDSTRFPGKPLADMDGKPMIQRVYERARPMVDSLYVATDDKRIAETVNAFSGKAVITSSEHRSGTDRCYEACCKVDGGEFDVVINIQGDEPFIRTEQIDLLKQCFIDDHDAQIATLIKPFDPEGDFEQTLFNPNTPKVVVNNRNEAMYFSRSIVPYIRGRKHDEWLMAHTFYKHIGVYAYRKDVLAQLTALPPSTLEIAESLEQLRWLQNGFRIKTVVTQHETIGVDTPQDMDRALEYLRAQNRETS